MNDKLPIELGWRQAARIYGRRLLILLMIVLCNLAVWIGAELIGACVSSGCVGWNPDLPGQGCGLYEECQCLTACEEE